MNTTHCPHCTRVIGYAKATVCPYCGKAIATASSSASSTARATPAVVSRIAGASVSSVGVPGLVSATSVAGPAIPESAAKGLRQLRGGLERLMKALRGDAGIVEVELALGEVAVALALLRVSDGWDLAEAGIHEALREFLEYAPDDDARGRRLRQLQDRLRAWFGDARPARPAPNSPVSIGSGVVQAARGGGAAALRAGPTSLLTLIEAWTAEEFEFDRWQSTGSAAPTVYCETLEDFYASFFAYRNLSPLEQARGVRDESEQARAVLVAGGGGVLGVNWPGRGCFLNGEAFARMHQKRDAADALRCPHTFPHILSTLVHEKLGHGWLVECTTRGQEIRSVHLEQHEVARHFLRRTTDDPREALLQDKWNLLLCTSKYAEEGYSTWMEAQVLGIAQRRLQAGAQVDERGLDLGNASRRRPAAKVLAAFREVGDPDCDDFAEVLEFVLAAGPSERRELAALFGGRFPHTSLVGESMDRDERLDQACSSAFGQPLHYIVGCLLVDKLEARFGARSVPCAMALAGNVSYGLDSISNADLRTVLDSNPGLRMDARLVLLGTLESVPGDDPDALFEMARRELSFTPPQLAPRKARR